MRYLQILRNQERPFRFVASRLLWHTGLCRFAIIRRPTFRLRFAPSGLSAKYWIDPHMREDDHALLRAWLRAGDTYVDVGANIGALALHAASLVGDAGRVVAIEAHPRIAGFLRANVELNRSRNVRVLNFAVGDRAGTLHFTDVKSDEKNGVDETGKLELPVRTLDELVGDTPGRIRLLKMDVEGFELNVLRGGATVLARTDCVYFEVSDRFRLYGYDAEDVVAALEAFGLTVLETGGAPIARPFLVGARGGDLVAVRDVEEYRERTAAPRPLR